MSWSCYDICIFVFLIFDKQAMLKIVIFNFEISNFMEYCALNSQRRPQSPFNQMEKVQILENHVRLQRCFSLHLFFEYLLFDKRTVIHLSYRMK